MIKARTFERRLRANTRDEGVSTRVIITGINTPTDGDLTVNVVPYDEQRIYELNGERSYERPLEIMHVPYAGVFTTSQLGLGIPPEIGMEGWLVITDYEVGEIKNGRINTDRNKDHASGWFVPAGKLTGAPYPVSQEWFEFRGADGTRIAISKDEVHLQAGNANVCIKNGQWDIVVDGISLLGALKQMSAHIKRIEDHVHTDGTKHPLTIPREIDKMTAATCPNRNENGVR